MCLNVAKLEFSFQISNQYHYDFVQIIWSWSQNFCYIDPNLCTYFITAASSITFIGGLWKKFQESSKTRYEIAEYITIENLIYATFNIFWHFLFKFALPLIHKYDASI
jgi:hypothetical protein